MSREWSRVCSAHYSRRLRRAFNTRVVHANDSAALVPKRRGFRRLINAEIYNINNYDGSEYRQYRVGVPRDLLKNVDTPRTSVAINIKIFRQTNIRRRRAVSSPIRVALLLRPSRTIMILYISNGTSNNHGRRVKRRLRYYNYYDW